MKKVDKQSNKRITHFDPNEFEALMKERGFSSTRQLANTPNCFLTYETIRRAFNHPEETTAWSYFLMLHALGLPKQNIKRRLQDAGDKILHLYIAATDDVLLDECEVATINLFKKVLANLPDNHHNHLMQTLEFLAADNNIDIKEELEATNQFCSIVVDLAK